MKLKEWCNLTGIDHTHPTTETGSVSIIGAYDSPHYRKLWGLEDFRVSSACGAVLWLSPVKKLENPWFIMATVYYEDDDGQASHELYGPYATAQEADDACKKLEKLEGFHNAVITTATPLPA